MKNLVGHKQEHIQSGPWAWDPPSRRYHLGAEAAVKRVCVFVCMYVCVCVCVCGSIEKCNLCVRVCCQYREVYQDLLCVCSCVYCQYREMYYYHGTCCMNFQVCIEVQALGQIYPLSTITWLYTACFFIFVDTNVYPITTTKGVHVSFLATDIR